MKKIIGFLFNPSFIAGYLAAIISILVLLFYPLGNHGAYFTFHPSFSRPFLLTAFPIAAAGFLTAVIIWFLINRNKKTIGLLRGSLTGILIGALIPLIYIIFSSFMGKIPIYIILIAGYVALFSYGWLGAILGGISGCLLVKNK